MRVLTFGGLLAIVVYAIRKILVRPKNRGPLPPGPKPKPIIGNLWDFPPSGEQEWQHWLKHKGLYGPISSVSAFGQTIVLLNDGETAYQLLEKRSAVYSSRPELTFAGEMVGWDNAAGLLPYGPESREQRKLFHHLIGGTAVKAFYPVQEIEVRRFLFRILQSPQDILQHIRTEAGAIILKMSYGYTVEPHKHDPLVDLADTTLANFSAASVAGAWLVDVIPFLKYLPNWVPGAGFKRTAKEWRHGLLDATNKPYDFALRQIESGKYEPSFVSSYVKQKDGKVSPGEDKTGRWSAMSIYAGGSDTTVSTIACFFLAMTYYPSVLKKAQEEIDRVIGSGRLPTFDDRPNLPYIEAIVSEALRWHPIGPLGLPHMSTQDDTYNGYFLPKGTIFVANIWECCHDPKEYPDPLNFKPERFLGPNPGPDPRRYAFGFGRRICPGRALADCSVWLTIAKSVAALDIRHPDAALGGKADEIKFDTNLHFDPKFFCPGTISHPQNVKVDIRARSEEYERLIKDVEVEFPWQKSDSEAVL